MEQYETKKLTILKETSCIETLCIWYFNNFSC